MRLEAYVFFYGRTEEALAFYATALGGTYEVFRYAGSFGEAGVDASWKDKVMHATFHGDGFSFMASDGHPNAKRTAAGETEITLSLGSDDAAAAERIFNALADGGRVTQPFGEVPWGGTFGMVDDKYGVSWMITAAHG